MLSISQVSFRFGLETVLDKVSLDVARGSFVSFLGPSGCGKTTLLRVIAGFITPSEGTVAMEGRQLSSPRAVLPPEHRGMGMVFQNYAVWPHMSVYRNVAYGLRLRGMPKAELHERTMQALKLVNLDRLEARSPSELSGGQQQRVAIARSIATEPSLLLLDEPLSNLDVALRRDLLFDLKRIQQASGITFIYVTHDQGEALSVSDEVVVMDRGRVRQIGAPGDIYNEPADLFVASFVGHANIVAAIVGSVDGGLARLVLGKDAEISAPLHRALSPGTQCDVAIKRHGIKFRVLSGPEAAERCVGTVLRTFFGGDFDEVAVSIGEQEIYGFAFPNSLRTGDRVAVEVEAGSCHLFACERAA